jgi:flagellar secretion chaperone FliS
MNTYFEQMVLSASPLELIRILYRQADMSVRKARAHLKSGRIAERAECINNAYEVMTELIAALRPEEAPEIAMRLGELYGYVQRRLLEANFRQADEPLEEVLGLLAVLASAWEAAPEPTPKATVASNRWTVAEPMVVHAVRA